MPQLNSAPRSNLIIVEIGTQVNRAPVNALATEGGAGASGLGKYLCDQIVLRRAIFKYVAK